MHLLENQTAGLAARFRYFDAELTAALFHPDQTGKSEVKDREYPAVLMRNGVRWHYDRENRPAQKAMAPFGGRTLLTDDPELNTAPFYVIVEGEADAVALASVGQSGVAAVGGTNQAETMAPLFKGKRIYLLFDGDEAGRAGARQFALLAVAAGADVSMASLPEGQDPESWLEDFDTRDQAVAGLASVLGAAERVNPKELAKAAQEKDEAEGYEEITTWTGRLGDSLMVTVWDPTMAKPKLAVYGAMTVGEGANAAPPYPGQDVEPNLGRGWRILDEGLRMTDTRTLYRPGGFDGLLDMVTEGSLIVPPPPCEDEVDHGQLWDDVVAFYSEWLHASEMDYHVLAAFTFACWRLEDAKFQKAPFLRIHGASNSGKSRCIELVHLMGNMSMNAALTASNVHRVVEAFQEFTLCWDEFNMEKMSADARKELVNVMNLSQSRQARMLRMSPGEGKGADMIVRAYRLFGPKVFAGYLDSEDDGFRRRTVEIDLGKVRDVPSSIRWPQLPTRALEAARNIRGRMLAWRVAQLPNGLVDSEFDPSVNLMRDLGITGMSDAYWPLLYVAPEGHPAQAQVVAAMQHAEEVWGANKATKSEAFLLENIGTMMESGDQVFYTGDGTPVITILDVYEHVAGSLGHQMNDVRALSALLRQLQVNVSRSYRYFNADGRQGPRRLAMKLDQVNVEQLMRVAKVHGVELPPAVRARQEGGL